MGLSFSVPHGIRPPPSLQNIFKEIVSDIGGSIPGHGNLEKWAAQVSETYELGKHQWITGHLISFPGFIFRVFYC